MITVKWQITVAADELKLPTETGKTCKGSKKIRITAVCVCVRPALRTYGGNDDVDKHSNSNNYRYDNIIFLSITAK